MKGFKVKNHIKAQKSSSSSIYDRRDFLKFSAFTGMTAMAGMGLAGCTGMGYKLGPAPDQLFTAPPIENVRMGFVGVGGMGSAHVRNFLKIKGAQITAVCDIVEEKVTRIQKWVEEETH